MKLRGSRCPDCKRTVFGAQPPCPICGSKRATLVDLSREGRVETYTTMDGLVVGEVRLRDGTLVLGRLEVSEPEVGMPVVLRSSQEMVVFGTV